ncbi:hypothetical protein BDV59DRAFT_57871 [Aspergillus ambiguus]|uniref:uncharacterized protein n=1 Tax=Aspergillus ambiguus TaxID=176160 RepID=UPI003CCE3921
MLPAGTSPFFTTTVSTVHAYIANQSGCVVSLINMTVQPSPSNVPSINSNTEARLLVCAFSAASRSRRFGTLLETFASYTSLWNVIQNGRFVQFRLMSFAFPRLVESFSSFLSARPGTYYYYLYHSCRSLTGALGIVFNGNIK